MTTPKKPEESEALIYRVIPADASGLLKDAHGHRHAIALGETGLAIGGEYRCVECGEPFTLPLRHRWRTEEIDLSCWDVGYQ